MFFKTVGCSSFVFLALFSPTAGPAATWHVDGSVSASGDGKSWGTAFKTIQTGIDQAANGDAVIVARGTYYENIKFKGKNITLRSTDLLDPTVVASTIIDGSEAGSVVTFDGTEDESCVLSGFTIRNGTANGGLYGWNGGGICGGSFENPTRATIQNNTISDNCAMYGGGLAYCDGNIRDNAIVGNSAERYGGGLYGCHGTVRNNRIFGNSAEGLGGGLLHCDGVIENNVIAANDAPWKGGALWGCDGFIQNNTFASNSGGALCRCRGTIRNCIIWGNTYPVEPQLHESSEPTYSCIRGWTGPGEGNIALDPHFVDAAGGDFRLRSWSPCVDAGDPASAFSEEPEPNGGRVDMGAYGNTTEAVSRSPDTDGDGLPDDWELHWFGDLDEDGATDPDGDRILNAREYRYAWVPSAAAETLVENLTKGVCYQTIEPALRESDNGDEIVVHPGVYRENISFLGKNLVLRSSDPLDAAVRDATVIDGRQADAVVRFVGTEDETCVLAGFTICNGWAGGISGGTQDQHSRATIRNNMISGNSGSGLTYCDGLIENNIISRNSARYGSGLAYCDGRIENNVICSNSATELGGGLFECNGMIVNNTICHNSAEECAGLCRCHGPIRNCVIWGNAGWRQLNNCSIPTYSCIEGWTGGGEGNIACYPYFVDAAGGDYHLKSCSACIDSGDPGSPFSEEPEPNGGRIDMGAFGNTSEATSRSADTDADGLPDDWETLFFPDLAQGADDDPDGDLIPNVEEYRCGFSPVAPPALWHVDASRPTSGDGRSWETALRTIQEGIEAAFDRDTVVVAPGTYVENIQFKGKKIVVRSTDPTDPDIVGSTIIDGNKAGSVVTFLGTEGEMCTLAGFTIQNGEAEYGGGICGGKFGDNTGATIEWNRITGNSSETHGGGIVACDGVIRYNIITGNSSREGGGLAYCQGTIHNNIVAGNSAEYGGGITSSWETSSVIELNTIVGNSADYGGALGDCYGTIRNCIIWGNRSPCTGQVWRTSEPTYCCIEAWTGGGEGNITFNPRFVDPKNGDFHLRSVSPCIDAGDPDSPFSNEPEPNGGRVNMGAYGNTPEAACTPRDEDEDGLPDDWELSWFQSLVEEAAGDADGDGIVNITEYRYAWDPKVAAQTLVENSADGALYETIQAALSESSDGDEIVVYPRLYIENLQFGGRNVVLRSTDPWDPSVVARTIIDGDRAGPVVAFFGTEDETCVLSGFTIRNGRSDRGGGVGGAVWDDHARATIQNNVITDNSAGAGAGMFCCDGLIQNNKIFGNSAEWAGGGLYGCNGIIRNNVICGNTATEAYSSDGGGLCSCDGTIANNTIVGNRASGSIEFGGGGLAWCNGTIINCIIWGNEAPDGRQLYESSEPTYSCIQDWTQGGEGNIFDNPQFADLDHRLLYGSPCINKGKNEDWMWGAVDLDVNPRIWGGTVDMGAYEHGSFHFNVVAVVRQSSASATLTWSSRPGDTNIVWSSGDMLNGVWKEEDTVLSDGKTSSWTDDHAEVEAKFYRVELKPAP